MEESPPPPRHNQRSPLEYRALGDINPNERDPRTYDRATRRRIVTAVRRFGVPPIVVTAEGTIISGNVWLEAAKVAGYAEAPVLVAEHLTPAEAEAFMLANVRLVERGEWDQTKLGQILQDLSVGELEFDLELTGFEAAEIDLAIEGLNDASDEADPADLLPGPGPRVSRRGDLWLLGNHRLVCSDALDPDSYRRLMRDELAALVVSDPPYNTRIQGNVSGLGRVKHTDFIMASGEMTEAEFTDFLVRALTLAAAASAETSLAYIFMDWRHLHELTVASRRAYDEMLNLCVWAKTNGGMGSFYRSAHELVFVLKKGRGAHRNNVQLGRFGRNRTNVWSCPGINTVGRAGEEGDLLALHPTIKPVSLLADILLDASARGDIVLDPFGGSGSLAITAEKLGRRARLIELDPIYIDTAVRRWERWTGEVARLEGDGRTFLEIEAEREGEGAA